MRLPPILRGGLPRRRPAQLLARAVLRLYRRLAPVSTGRQRNEIDRWLSPTYNFLEDAAAELWLAGVVRERGMKHILAGQYTLPVRCMRSAPSDVCRAVIVALLLLVGAGSAAAQSPVPNGVNQLAQALALEGT